tara:strand:+ start:222 stop:617 length:396 start_codon:yes stop_codon:yes gene_type:complete
MKYLTPVSFVFMLNMFGGCAKQHVEYSIEEFMNTTSYSGSSFSPDERSILFTSNKSGIYNAFKVDINSGETSQLTQSDTNSVFAISYFPNDERILYRSDNNVLGQYYNTAVQTAKIGSTFYLYLEYDGLIK